MNWSTYSRFVGNVFGGPLAMEGLVAFFVESTFLGHLDLRLGPSLEEGPSGLHLAGGRRRRCCRPRSSWRPTRGCSTRSATSSTSTRQAPAEQHLGPVHQPGLPVGLPPRRAGLAGHRRHRHAGRLGLAPAAARTRSTAFRRTAVISLVVLAPGHLPEHVRRQRARRGRGQVPADEDRRRRGAVEHLSVALLVLAVPDRRRQERRDPDPDHRDPRPAVHPGHQPRRRRGAGPQQPAGPVPEAVRARGTTSPTSSSSTGACGSWPTWRRWSCCSPCGEPGCCATRQLGQAQVVPAHRALGGRSCRSS